MMTQKNIIRYPLKNTFNMFFLYSMDEAGISISGFRKIFSDDAYNVDLSIFPSDEEMINYLNDHRTIPWYRPILGTQFEMEKQSYWIKCGQSEYFHNNENYSSFEKAAPITYLMTFGNNNKLFNAYAHEPMSYTSKVSIERSMKIKKTNVICSITIPNKDTPLDECLVSFGYNENYPFICKTNFSINQQNEDFPRDYINQFIPKIYIDLPDTIKPNEKIYVSVSIVDPITNQSIEDNIEREIFIDTTSGYINKNRLYIKNAPEQFTLRAKENENGDKIKLKFGWKNITGVSERIIEVKE